jgi:hypothetical protein
MATKKCIVCGREFETKRAHTRTCGSTCRKKLSRGKARPEKSVTVTRTPKGIQESVTGGAPGPVGVVLGKVGDINFDVFHSPEWIAARIANGGRAEEIE